MVTTQHGQCYNSPGPHHVGHSQLFLLRNFSKTFNSSVVGFIVFSFICHHYTVSNLRAENVPYTVFFHRVEMKWINRSVRSVKGHWPWKLELPWEKAKSIAACLEVCQGQGVRGSLREKYVHTYQRVPVTTAQSEKWTWPIAYYNTCASRLA